MTSETSTERTIATPAPPPQSSQAAAVIDEQLRKTRLQVKGVDIATGLLTLGLGAIGYLFALALADHWLVSGGLGFYTRLAAIAFLLLAGGVWAYFRILRPLLGKINPVYVAQTIEQSRLSLKNSLINFLLLRGSPQGLSKGVYQAVETRAADDLAEVSPEAVVDRRHVVRLAVALVVLVLVGGIYHVASPKSPLTSAVRIAWPWTPAAAPTRVTIADVKPGDAKVFYGDSIEVSAEVSGVSAGEAVTLYFDTADGQSVGEAVPMRLPEGGYRHRCQLPPGKLGLRQDLHYYIAAGDCRTERYAIAVETPPSIEVERIDYKYPRYTEIPDRTAERQGDIRAVEGTEITIHAAANMAVRDAEIDLNCDGLRSLRMSVDGKDDTKAVGRFTLRMSTDDPLQPQYDRYQLRFNDREGRPNLRPTRYNIEVIADLAPRVEFVNPPGENVEVPENGTLRLAVEAEDPDYALRKVTIRGEFDNRSLPIRPMLDKPAAEPPHKGPFQGKYVFVPATLGLKAGDRVVYWAEATDNKTPIANTAETPRLWLTVVAAAAEERRDEKQDEQQQGKEQKNDGQQGEQQQGEGQQGEQQQQQQGEGQEGEQQQQGEGQEGQEQQGQGKQEQGQQEQGQQGEKQQQQSEGREGEQQQQPGQGQQGEEQKSEGQQGGQQQGEQQQGEQQQGQEQQGKQGAQGGEEKTQDGQGEKKPSEPIDGESNPGDVFDKALEHINKQQEKQTGEEKPADEKPGEGQQGEEKPADEKQGEGKQGEENSADEKPGEGKQGEEKSADEKPGEGEQGEEKSAEQKPGEGEQGEEKSADKKQGEGEQGEEKSAEEKPAEEKQGEGEQGEEKAAEQKPGEDQQGEGEKEAQQGEKPGEGKQGEQTEQGKPAAEQPAEGKPGEGEKTEQKPAAEQAGEGEKGERKESKEEKKETERKQSEQKAPGESGAPSGLSPSDAPTGDPTPPQTEDSQGEEYNKQYADKVTDLVLEEFQKQLAKQKPDQELLDSLGWSREELERFTKRWAAMKKAAKEGEAPAARRELDDALRSLGLAPSRTDLRGGTQKDEIDRLRERPRIAPPAKWAPQTKAYKQSIGGKNEE